VISPYSFRLSFVSGDTELPVPPAAEILAMVRARPPWDEASIAPDQEQFPRLHIARCAGPGFILHCFEDEESWGDFLVTGLAFSTPTIEINLGGQALERWPPELFISEQIAEGALSFFLKFGKQEPMRQWTKGDGFPRETVWEGREQGEAWERAKRVV
jgi:hypothetical protein